MTDNEKLIEEAAATIAVAELVRTHRTWGDLIEPQKDEYRRVARATLAVFEKAHTPTDDEREALRIAELDARQAAYRQDRTDWYVDHEHEPGITTNAFFRGWDAAVDGGFRRSEVQEPSADDVVVER